MSGPATVWAIVWWLAAGLGGLVWLASGGLILHMTTLVVLPIAVASAFSCLASTLRLSELQSKAQTKEREVEEADAG